MSESALLHNVRVLGFSVAQSGPARGLADPAIGCRGPRRPTHWDPATKLGDSQ